MSGIALPRLPVFERVGDVAAGLAELERALGRRSAGLAAFASAYRRVTELAVEGLCGEGCADDHGLTRYIVSYADLYRQALEDWANGRRERVPGAWRVALDVAAIAERPPLTALVLGIHAHVHRDLPYALIRAGIDLRCERRRREYSRYDALFTVATPWVRREVIRSSGRGRRTVAWAAGPWFDRVVVRALRAARKRAWDSARALADAAATGCDGDLEQRLEVGTECVARRIAGSAGRPLRSIRLLARCGDVPPIRRRGRTGRALSPP